jgi:hypothetical protein
MAKCVEPSRCSTTLFWFWKLFNSTTSKWTFYTALDTRGSGAEELGNKIDILSRIGHSCIIKLSSKRLRLSKRLAPASHKIVFIISLFLKFGTYRWIKWCPLFSDRDFLTPRIFIMFFFCSWDSLLASKFHDTQGGIAVHTAQFLRHWRRRNGWLL